MDWVRKSSRAAISRAVAARADRKFMAKMPDSALSMVRNRMLECRNWLNRSSPASSLSGE